MSETIDLPTRFRYLLDGAQIGAMLAHAARHGTMENLAVAVQTLDREQLEAAAFALVLVHVEGVPIDDE